MGKCRNTNGKLSYTAVNSNKDVFSITCGDNRIIKHAPYMTTDPWLDENGMWFDIPREFDSFIHAVMYLKENLEKLF